MYVCMFFMFVCMRLFHRKFWNVKCQRMHRAHSCVHVSTASPILNNKEHSYSRVSFNLRNKRETFRMWYGYELIARFTFVKFPLGIVNRFEFWILQIRSPPSSQWLNCVRMCEYVMGIMHVYVSNDDARFGFFCIVCLFYLMFNFVSIAFTCMLRLEVDSVLLPTLKSVRIYRNVGTENVWMRVIARHPYCYCPVATIAYNGVQHSHSLPLGIPGVPVPIDLVDQRKIHIQILPFEKSTCTNIEIQWKCIHWGGKIHEFRLRIEWVNVKRKNE